MHYPIAHVSIILGGFVTACDILTQICVSYRRPDVNIPSIGIQCPTVVEEGIN